MNKIFLFIFLFTILFFGSIQRCFAEDFLETVNDVHMVKDRNQIGINKYILKNYNIDRTKADQLRLLIQTRLGIEAAVYEEWKKMYAKEFSSKERDYLTMLYNSELMKKFFNFNTKFATRKEVQNIIKSKIGTAFKTATIEPNKPAAKK